MGFIKNYFMERKARKQVLKYDDKTLDAKVKIQGTEFDRKRKYDFKTVEDMRYLYIVKGKSISEISKIFEIPYTTVAYNVDEDFKVNFNAKRSGKHTGKDNITKENRAQYKRYLVKKKKIKVAGVI